MGRKPMNKKRTGEDFWKELRPLFEYKLMTRANNTTGSIRFGSYADVKHPDCDVRS